MVEQTERGKRGCVAGESSPMVPVNFTSSSSPGQHKAQQVLGLRGRALGGVCELYSREGSKRLSELGRGVWGSPRWFSDKEDGGVGRGDVVGQRGGEGMERVWSGGMCPGQ